MPLTDALPDRAAPATGRLLAVHGLRKHWPGRAEPTLDELDLELDAGDVVSVLGRNGAGKTTLLRILGGLVEPDAGTVALDGIALGTRRREYQRRIGLLTPGDRGLYARMTVERQLDLGARLALLADRERGVRWAFERFALAELGETRVDRLSMGQRQRVRLALTFLHAPALVLLDEPATSLDSDALALLRDAVEEVRARGGICLAVAPEGASTGLPGRQLALRDGRLEDA